MKVLIRPANREDCDEIFNLSRQRQQQLSRMKSKPLSLVLDEQPSPPPQDLLLTSSKELERDGFDIIPPLFHCLVALITKEEVVDDDDQTKHGDVDLEAADDHVVYEDETSSQKITEAAASSSTIIATKNNAKNVGHNHNSNDSSKIIGFALYFISYPIWHGKGIFLSELCVEPQYEQYDVGSLILQELAKIAVAGNFVDIRFCCPESNTQALTLYKQNHGVNFTEKEQWNWFTLGKNALKDLQEQTTN